MPNERCPKCQKSIIEETPAQRWCLNIHCDYRVDIRVLEKQINELDKQVKFLVSAFAFYELQEAAKGNRHIEFLTGSSVNDLDDID